MKYIPLAARICLSIIFFKAGFQHLFAFNDFVGYIGQTIPLAPLWAIGTIAFQLLGALSLLLGYQIRMGSTLLIIFLIPASILFHNFLADPSQLNSFLKNLGLIGGLLMMIYSGAGAVSLEEKLQ